MLEQFRKLAQSKIGFPIIALMILGMAAFGIEDIFSGGIGNNIIKAGERTASEQQINRKFENYLNNVRRDDPGNSITRQTAVQQGILDQIFNVEKSRLTNLGYARSLGADASGEALLADVNAIEAFKNPLTNTFDSQYYRNALNRINVTPREFESDTQDRLTLDYMREGVSAALLPPTDIARVQAIFDGEVRYISFLPIDQKSLPALGEPDEEALIAFYKSQLASFEIPERRRLSLLNLSAEDFANPDEVSEEEISSYYELTKTQRLATPELRVFEEFIFPDERSAKAAFGTLAVGGDLEDLTGITLTKRTLKADDVADETFRQGLFTTGVQPGAVVGPLKVSDRWMVGRLTEIQPGTPKTLEETREDIRTEIAAEKAEIAFYTALSGFDDLIGQGLSLTEIAERYKTTVSTFPPVTSQAQTQEGEFQQGLTLSPEAFAQAFELPAGRMTNRFDLDVRTILISVDEILPKETPPFEELQERVKAAYRVVKAREALKTTADSVKTAIDTGNSTLEEQATLYESAVETPERGLRRTAFDRSLPQSVLRAAFTLEETGSEVVQGRTQDELIIVYLDRIDRPKPSELDILAPISAPKIAEQLDQDILFAFEMEVQKAIATTSNDSAFAAYKKRLLEDQ